MWKCAVQTMRTLFSSTLIAAKQKITQTAPNWKLLFLIKCFPAKASLITESHWAKLFLPNWISYKLYFSVYSSAKGDSAGENMDTEMILKNIEWDWQVVVLPGHPGSPCRRPGAPWRKCVNVPRTHTQPFNMLINLWWSVQSVTFYFSQDNSQTFNARAACI